MEWENKTYLNRKEGVNMDNAKYERIRDFVNGWGYKAEEVNAYISQVAPNLEFNAKKARHDAMNAFFMGILGQEAKPKAGTPVPEPGIADNSGLARDLWIMLGTGPDALTLEDIADYYAEHISRLEAQKEAEAPSSMNFSRMIYAMGAEDRQQQSCADIIERHKKANERKESASMDSFLRNLNTEADSTPRTLTAPSAITAHTKRKSNKDINDLLRNLL